LIDTLGLSSITNRGPLFSVVVRHEAIHDVLPEVRCDAIVTLYTGQDALTGHIEFNARLFDSSVIPRVAEHIAVVLRQGLGNPSGLIGKIEVLTNQEREHMSGAPVAPTRDSTSIAELFARQCERAPDAVAIAFGAEQITYRALDRRANKLARHLHHLGVTACSQVGIYLQRSPDLVVAVLAILKLGATSVPMDPSFPDERLSRIAASADGLAAILVDQPLPRATALTQSTKVVWLSAGWSAIVGESEARFCRDTTDQMLAYVLYTSGSTGRPKAVALTYGCLGNLIRWQLAEYPAHVANRTLQFASIAFDVSFQEIFATLCAGGTLVLVADDVRRDPARLLDVLVDGGVSRLFLPYAALSQLALGAKTTDTMPDRLRDLFVAGEQLQITAAVIELLRRLPDCRLHNQYGPTESHVVTALTLDGTPSRWPRLPPIGRAIAKTAVYLTDAGLRQVPLGAPGELCIGGAAMGWGYLGWPEMTAQKFVPDPFSALSGARLYRTGDIARFMPDGNIEFLGRGDDQVKIRGYRVEPGEIEAALSRHAAIREAVVVPRDGGHGGRILVAYMVLNCDRAITVEQLRSHLRGAVPDYAIPSDWIEIDAFPLTSSGKTDRRSLPSVTGTRQLPTESYVPPRSPIEHELAQIWAAVLKRPMVGINEDFFELGGHSLLATQAVARIEEALHVELSITAFFEARTIERLAVEVQRLRAAPIDGTAATSLRTQSQRNAIGLP
jgi:amino acid adenylation domain-containing protein